MMYQIQRTLSLICLLVLGGTTLMLAQKDEAALRRADQMPTFKDCPEGDVACTKEKLRAYIDENLKYPKEAKDAQTGGAAIVSFVIEKNGKVSEVETMVDPGMGIGKEAIRVIQSLNKSKLKWRPGVNEGKKVRVKMIQSVQFNMELEAKPEAEKTEEVAPGEEVFMTVEEMPKFEGCAELTTEEAQRCTFNGIVKHVQTNLKYPEEAKLKNVEGMVLVSFVVDKSGKLRDAKVIQALSPECDKEALRVVSSIPNWTPGMLSGNAVHVRMNIPIQFRPAKKKEQPKEEAPKKQEEKKEGGN